MARLILATVFTLLALPLLLAADKKPDAKEVFKERSLWEGSTEPDPRWADRHSFPARLRVLKRDGQKFVANFWVKTPRHGDYGVQIEGVLNGNVLDAHVARVLTGEWGGGILESTWHGEINGNDLILQRTGSKQHTTATAKLQLNEKSRSAGDD